MKAAVAVALIAMLGAGAAQAAGSHYVRGYTRSNGTYVAPHYQTNPNSTRNDNWSTRGNVNPYTGQPGTKPGDSGPAVAASGAVGPTAAAAAADAGAANGWDAAGKVVGDAPFEPLGWTIAGRSDSATLYYRTPQRFAQYQQIWIRLEFTKPTERQALSVAELVQVDCQVRQLRTLQTDYFPENNLGGKSTEVSGYLVGHYAVPGSIDDAIAGLACR